MKKWCFGLLMTLTASAPVQAHALGAQCKLQKDCVEAEAYYDDDTAGRDAKVRVEDADKKVVSEGRTDAKGFWMFPRPQAGKYLVVVDAGAGHVARVRITVPEEPQESAATVAGASSKG